MIKKFEEFVNESFQFFWVTLVTREVECDKLTEDEFVEYMLEDINFANDKYKSLTKGNRDIGCFDFKVDPNSMSSEAVGPKDNAEKMRRCFNEIKNSKYFKLAKGWEFTYRTEKSANYESCFRPQIKLILDDETQRKYLDDHSKLVRSIDSFYSDKKYNKYD